MRPQEQDWKCIELENINDRVESSAQHAVCLHLIDLSNIHLNKSATYVLATDNHIYQEDVLKSYLKVSSVNPYTGEKISHETRPVRLAIAAPSPSKLDFRKKVSYENPLVLVCRSEKSEDSTVIMVEKKDQHMISSISVYQFIRKIDDSICIQQDEISSLEYCQIATADILQKYAISAEQAKARSFMVSLKQLQNLEKVILDYKTRAESGKIRYWNLSGKIVVDLTSIFSKVSYHNACTWARRVLQKAEILSDSAINFDRNFSIFNNATLDKLRGAVPDSVMPPISTHLNSTPRR